MTLLLMLIPQLPEGGGGVPELGVRLSIWFIGMFLLAVGGALLWLRIRETESSDGRGE